MANKFTRFIKANKNRIDIIKSSFSIFLGILLIVALIFLAVTLSNTTRSLVQAASAGIDRIHETISLVNDGLENVSESFDIVSASLQTMKGYVSGIEPVLSSVKKIVGTDLVNIAERGRDSLLAAAQGSKIVDDSLTLLSRLPLIKFEYQPKKSLNESLLDLSDTFASIPESLNTLEVELTTSTKDLNSFEDQFEDLTKNVNNMKGTMSETSLSVRGFLDNLLRYKDELPKIQKNIIIWISIITSLLCLVILIWLLREVYCFIVAREGLLSDRITRDKKPEG